MTDTREIDIRAAHDSDAPGIVELIGATYAEYPGCILDVEADEPQLLLPASYYTAGGGGFWVAESSAGQSGAARIVGSIACLGVKEGQQLFNFYLSRDQRGSGLAGRLFSKVLEHSERHKAASIVLWTDSRFSRAHRFYERLGFVRGPMMRSLADRSWSVEFFYRLDLNVYGR